MPPNTQDPAVAKYMVRRPHTDFSQTQAFIEGCIEALVQGQGSQAVRGSSPPLRTDPPPERPTYRNAGSAGQGHLLEIGYVLAQSEWGNAYMLEAINALLTLTFQVERIFRAQVTCDIDNHASARTLEKCGFVREGKLAYWTVHPNISDIPRSCSLSTGWRQSRISHAASKPAQELWNRINHGNSLKKRELDRCEKSFRARNDFSPFGPRFTRGPNGEIKPTSN